MTTTTTTTTIKQQRTWQDYDNLQSCGDDDDEVNSHEDDDDDSKTEIEATTTTLASKKQEQQPLQQQHQRRQQHKSGRRQCQQASKSKRTAAIECPSTVERLRHMNPLEWLCVSEVLLSVGRGWLPSPGFAFCLVWGGGGCLVQVLRWGAFGLLWMTRGSSSYCMLCYAMQCST